MAKSGVKKKKKKTGTPYLKNDYLYSDVKAVLEDLSKENELYLVTARNNKDGCFMQLKSCGIEQYFKEIEIVDSSKDTAWLKTEVLQNYQIDCFVGDTELDCMAAEQADCNFFAMNRGFRIKDYWDRKNILSFNSLTNINFVK